MRNFNCYGVSEGYGIGRALVLKKNYELSKESLEGKSKEKDKYYKSLRYSVDEINTIIDTSPDTRDIMSAHIMLLEDVEFENSILSGIEEGLSAEYSVYKSAKLYQDMFSAIEDEYLRERAADIKDISERLIDNIIGKKNKIEMKEDSIIISEDLLPSETANLDKKYVRGIVTKVGGKTSHTAILANIIGVAAVSEFNDIDTIKDNDLLIVDGFNGQIIVNPDYETLEKYKSKSESYNKEKNILNKYKNLRAKTKDGRVVATYANISSLEDMKLFEEFGAEGVGLFRTEFLFMQSDKEPSVDEQTKCYREVLEKANSKAVIFRTLDIGGDKDIPYMDFPKEDNPFLGFRAVRYCLENTSIFKNQLRSILMASIYGDAWIMIPMVSNLEEIRKVKKIIEEVETQLRDEGTSFNKCKLGIMIETPSAAIMSDVLAKEVDFFSIGTNDLTQYTLACDRMNSSLKYLYDYLDPAVIRLIYMTIKAAKENNIHVGICGEAAADKLLIPLLMIMGIDELSMSPRKILKTRQEISALNLKDEGLVDMVLGAKDKDEVISILRKINNQ